MHRTRALVAFILIAAGLVWVGQGTGVLKGTGFMVGDARWAWIGALCVVAGFVVAWREVRSRRA
jgi:hypothetical protein